MRRKLNAMALEFNGKNVLIVDGKLFHAFFVKALELPVFLSSEFSWGITNLATNSESRLIKSKTPSFAVLPPRK